MPTRIAAVSLSTPDFPFVMSPRVYQLALEALTWSYADRTHLVDNLLRRLKVPPVNEEHPEVRNLMLGTLSHDDQIALVDELVSSLKDQPPDGQQPEWGQTLQRRSREISTGEVICCLMSKAPESVRPDLRLDLNIHPQAADELEAAANSLDEQHPGTRRRFLADMVRTSSHLQLFPLNQPPFLTDYRKLNLSNFPHEIVFEIRQENLAILAVKHVDELHPRPVIRRAY